MSVVTAGSPHNSIARGRSSICHGRATRRSVLNFSVSLMELWGDPAVTALIDSRGKLTNAQVGEKLRAEIERERSGGVQYSVLGAVRSPQWRVRRLRRASA